MFGPLSRTIGIGGVYPVPGQDLQAAPWMELMKAGEYAVFYFDRAGQILQPTGEKAPAPMHEICLVFHDKKAARLVMRGARMMIPGVTVAMYDKRGRWLETQNREGVRRRKEDLDFALFMLQIPLLTALGTILLGGSTLYSIVRHQEPIDWQRFTINQWLGSVIIGLFIGAFLKLLWTAGREAYIVRASRGGRAPMGSKERDQFYKQLEKAKSVTSTPLDVELERTEIAWPDSALHDAWAASLNSLGFEPAGSYNIVRSPSCIEFFIHPAHRITANCTLGPRADMWTEMVTRYEDGTAFIVSAHESPGLDPHPKRTTVRLPRTATVEEILQKMLAERPQKPMEIPQKDEVVTRFKKSWREYMEWRRAKGTSAEEYKRVDQKRVARKAAQSEGKQV